MMWWVTNSARLTAEIAELEALRDRSTWLSGIRPHFRNTITFSVDFDLTVEGSVYQLRIEYPALFPDTPPSVMPRDGRRLSGHQYPGGELCLEYRSDNWDPRIHGALLVQSAYRLLDGEQPTADGAGVVPSAHYTTIGQSIRGTKFRFLVTKSLMEYVTSLAPGEYTECQIAEVMGKSSAWVAHVQSIGHGAELLWSESTIPARSGTPVSALLIRVDSIKAPAIDVTLLDTIVNSTCPSGYVESTADTRWIVLADSDSASLYVMYRKDGEWILWSYHTLDLTSDRFSRLPDAYKGLRSKKIGFAGCGSLGAKIATSLARSGVGGFVLVDDDVFLPENVVRNDLDGASLGMHKAEALAERLHAVSSQVSVSVRRVLLGGQESSGTTATVLDELATCDLLIDATADAQAFNYVAAVARSALRPMIWAEVYAGGVGGFVGRLRPNIEPPPHQARHQYLQWCDERDVPWQRHDSDYESRGSGEPLVADDADVSTIAAHATKMAIDCLINPTNTMYPHAAYVIGLRAEWIFTEPLQVWPLNFVPNGDWQAKECESKPEDVKYILQLLGNSFDEGRGRT